MKEIKITSMGKIVHHSTIEHCCQCPCYDDGASGEYGESCMINPDGVYMEMPYGDEDHGISPQCPLEDIPIVLMEPDR